jgi:putative salt-induced outer membrane protein YdiY
MRFKTIDEQGTDMNRSATVLATAGLLFFFLTATASADEVFLKNGNRLSGTIVSMSEGKLVLETDFAGQLTIGWNHVDQLATDAPLTLVLADGSIIRGTPTSGETPGRIKLAAASPADPAPVELARVTAINPPDEQPIKLNGRINVGFNKASGNTDLKNTHIDAELLARTVSHRVTLGGAYNRASEDNRKTEDNAMGHLKHDYFLTQAFYWYLNGLAERDRFKNLSLRTTIGPGVGYQFFEGELMNLSVETGPSYVYTNYDGAGRDESLSGRWGVTFDRFFFEKLFQYYFSSEGYVSASDTSDVFMFTRSGLRFPIRGGLSLNAGFEWDWDNTPAEDADKSDYRYILSVGYGF